jgi:hypothetical protein
VRTMNQRVAIANRCARRTLRLAVKKIRAFPKGLDSSLGPLYRVQREYKPFILL